VKVKRYGPDKSGWWEERDQCDPNGLWHPADSAQAMADALTELYGYCGDELSPAFKRRIEAALAAAGEQEDAG
jgi:hypothetical protein